MLMSVLGAALVGAAASAVLPFLPFAAALSLAIAIGAAWTLIGGHAAAAAILGALALLMATQVGYGLGLLLAAAFDGRRARRPRGAVPEADRGAVRDLRFGKES